MVRAFIPLGIGLIVAWQPAWAAPHCRYNTTFMIPGQDSEARVVAPAGLPCHVFFRSSRNRSEWSIVSRPLHGTLLPVGAQGWDYTPTRGYSGPDAFTVEVSGEVMGRYVYSGSSKVLFAINVVP